MGGKKMCHVIARILSTTLLHMVKKNDSNEKGLNGICGFVLNIIIKLTAHQIYQSKQKNVGSASPK
jgi:hypothetical protein